MAIHGVQVVSIPDAHSLGQIARDVDQFPPDIRGPVLREEVMKRILEETEVRIDDGLLDARVDLMIDRHKMQLEAGATFEQQLAASCTSEVALRLELRSVATEKIRQEAVIHYLAETNGITVTAQDLDEPIATLAGMLDVSTDEARDKLTREGRLPAFFQTVLFEKVTDFLVEQALAAKV
jgi:FKBP-type peptidyl-prolyl cis-trans isomerase (trigger factor)